MNIKRTIMNNFVLVNSTNQIPLQHITFRIDIKWHRKWNGFILLKEIKSQIKTFPQ